MKKQYMRPTLSIIKVDVTDIIATSLTLQGNDYSGGSYGGIGTGVGSGMGDDF